jgi:hypothetical protein
MEKQVRVCRLPTNLSAETMETMLNGYAQGGYTLASVSTPVQNGSAWELICVFQRDPALVKEK